MAEKLSSDEVEDDTLGAVAEAPIGCIKEVWDFRRCNFRGLHKAKAVWALVCLVLNVKRLHTA